MDFALGKPKSISKSRWFHILPQKTFIYILNIYIYTYHIHPLSHIIQDYPVLSNHEQLMNHQYPTAHHGNHRPSTWMRIRAKGCFAASFWRSSWIASWAATRQFFGGVFANGDSPKMMIEPAKFRFHLEKLWLIANFVTCCKYTLICWLYYTYIELVNGG